MALWLDWRHMPAPSPDLEQLAANLLEVVGPLLTNLQRAAPASDAGAGVTRSQLAALRFLAERGACTMSELADGVGVTAPSMTATVKLLVKNGLAKREHDQQDWRTVHVTAAAAGLDAYRRYDHGRAEALARCLQALSAEQRAMLLVALPSLRALAQQAASLPQPGRGDDE
jgi:DNA-binding MarR family transcriptional regulator